MAVDISQMIGIRFGETIKAYVSRYGDAKQLKGPGAVRDTLKHYLHLGR